MSTLKFNPPKTVARYALFVDHGNGQGFFKTYNDLGIAKVAHSHRNYGGRYAAKILENVEGQWYVLHDIKAGTTYENLPWVKETQGGYWTGYNKRKKAIPMTRDEYAEWRVAVERERIADGSASLDLNPGRNFVSLDAYSSSGI